MADLLSPSPLSLSPLLRSLLPFVDGRGREVRFLTFLQQASLRFEKRLVERAQAGARRSHCSGSPTAPGPKAVTTPGDDPPAAEVSEEGSERRFAKRGAATACDLSGDDAGGGGDGERSMVHPVSVEAGGPRRQGVLRAEHRGTVGCPPGTFMPPGESNFSGLSPSSSREGVRGADGLGRQGLARDREGFGEDRVPAMEGTGEEECEGLFETGEARGSLPPADNFLNVITRARSIQLADERVFGKFGS